MSKYIDADKLKAEIEKLKVVLSDPLMIIPGPDYVAGGKKIAKEILALIDSLQQEQQNDVCAEIKDYYGEDLAFEDERTKAAYYFFSAGRSFELRAIEEERGKHITDLLKNFEKGMKAGYEKAISEFQEGELGCSPVMKEFISKFFEIGNATNFGFGPMKLQQEQPDVDIREEIKKLEFMGSNDNRDILHVAEHFYELGLKAK